MRMAIFNIFGFIGIIVMVLITTMCSNHQGIMVYSESGLPDYPIKKINITQTKFAINEDACIDFYQEATIKQSGDTLFLFITGMRIDHDGKHGDLRVPTAPIGGLVIVNEEDLNSEVLELTYDTYVNEKHEGVARVYKATPSGNRPLQGELKVFIPYK